MASESGGWLNRVRVILGRGCGCGVVGLLRESSAGFSMIVRGVSGTLLGWAAVVGESPVRENIMWVVAAIPE